VIDIRWGQLGMRRSVTFVNDNRGWGLPEWRRRCFCGTDMKVMGR
jgi:hypothetical protein